MRALGHFVRTLALGGTALAVAAVALAPVAAAAPTDSVGITVVNGRAPVTGEMGSLVVVYPDGFLCGGTVASPTKVVTAAHCVVNDNGSAMRPADITVGVPNGRRAPSTGQYRVSSVVVHPQYRGEGNDIAVLTLTTAITGRTPVPAVSAAEATALLATGAAVTSAGWGTTSSGGNSPDDFLVADLKVFPQAACSGTGTYQISGVAFRGLGSNVSWAVELCAAGVKGTNQVIDTCQGDSGGPLLAGTGVGTRLVGVVSWGDGCAGFEDGRPLNPITPGVYTRVSAMSAWLTSQGVPVGGSTPVDPIDPIDPIDPVDPTLPTPTVVSATPASGRLTVTASIPTSTRGSIRMSAGSAGTCTAQVTSRQASCVITGLSNSSSYFVTAVFLASDGRASAASAAFEALVAGKPGRPKVGDYYSLDRYGRVVIGIRAGAGNGDAPTTTVQCTASGRSAVTRTVTTPRTRLDLAQRQLWTCRVTSTNVAGSTSTSFTLKP